MKTSELRLGNILGHTFDSMPQYYIVTEIGLKIVSLQTLSSVEIFDSIPCEHLKPIVLTPELLVQCGLKKCFDSDRCNIWDTVDEALTRNKVFSLASIDKGWLYLAAPGAIPFHYLHQLQNLVFALTRTELTINTPTKE